MTGNVYLLLQDITFSQQSW